MSQVIDKKSIAPTLKGLKRKESTTFEMSKYKGSVLRASIQRIQVDEGTKFSCVMDKSVGVYVVTRTF